MANDVDLSNLIIEVDAEAGSAEKTLDSVASALVRLNSNSRITRTVNNLTKLSTALRSFQGLNASANSITKISYAIKNLSSVQKLSGLNSALNTLRKLPEAIAGLNPGNLTALSSAIQPLSDAVSKLGSIQKLSGLNSVINTLKKIPQLTTELKGADLNEFASQMERLKTAIAPLASEMEKVSKGFSSLPTNIQKAIAANQRLTASASRTTTSVDSMGSAVKRLASSFSLLYIVDRVSQFLGSALANFNSYVENVNLFSVSMGEFVTQATAAANKMQTVLGVDASEAMRNMGVLQNLVTSFGAAGDQAFVLSENLTQLGYDMASFFNISTDDAFTKLQAAISGELEPIRRLGVDISEARLQQELYNLGINQSVQNLSQADKALLRYIAIMDQTSNAQGDMARTLNSPANQIRIFQQQITLLSRAVGSLFIPMLNAILPPLIAIVEVAREAVSALAALFGVTVDFSSSSSSIGASTGAVSSGLDNIGSSAGSAADAVHELIGGFDELNVLPDPSKGSGGGGGAGGGGGVLGGIDLPSYDMYANLVKSKVADMVDKIKGALSKLYDTLEPFIPLLKGIAAAIATAFAIKAIVDFWRKLKTLLATGTAASVFFEALRQGALGFTTAFEAGEGLMKSFSAGLAGFRAALPLWVKIATVAATSVGAFVTAYDAFKKLATGSMELGNALAITAIGLTAFSAAAWAVAGPVGLVVTLVSGALGAFIGYKNGIDEVAEAAYNASVEHQILDEVISSSADISERAATAQQTLKDKISAVDDAASSYMGIRSLVDDIFELSDKSGKSASDLIELRTKVQMVNDMNLDGLKFELDDTGQHVLQTKDSVDQLVDSLQKTAYQAALQDVLTEAYKQQIQAQIDLQTATQNYDAALEQSNQAESARAQYLKDAGTWGSFLTGLGLDATYTALADACDEANQALSDSNQAMQDAQGTLDSANAAVDTYTQKLVDVQNGNFDLATSVQSSSSVIADAAAKYGKTAEDYKNDSSDMSSKLNSDIQGVASTYASAYDSMVSTVTSGSDTASDTAQRCSESMQNSANSVASTYAAAYGKVNSESQNSAKVVSSASDAAAGSVENAAGRSENALSGLPEKSATWGSDFASNFAKGFSDKWNSVKDTFSNVAQWISDRFHFSVPDKGPLSTADTWMPDMVDLFATTLTQSKPKLVTALDSVSRDMQTAFNSVSNPNFGGVQAVYSAAVYPSRSLGSGDDDTDKIVAAIQSLEQAILAQGGTTVTVDGKTLLTAVKKQIRSEQMRTGANPLL